MSRIGTFSCWYMTLFSFCKFCWPITTFLTCLFLYSAEFDVQDILKWMIMLLWRDLPYYRRIRARAKVEKLRWGRILPCFFFLQPSYLTYETKNIDLKFEEIVCLFLLYSKLSCENLYKLFTELSHKTNTTLCLVIHLKKQWQGILLEAIRVYYTKFPRYKN